VWAGGWILAFVAGIINVVGFLGFAHQGITHLTGTTTLLGAAVTRGNYLAAANLAALIAAFVLGAAVSGWIIGDSTLQLGKRYGVTLLLEAALLCAAVPLLAQHRLSGEWLTAAACGLQNAMATTYSGATIRSTHVSGMFTDLGIYIGQALHRTPFVPQRLQMSLVVITGFLAGGLAGTFFFDKLGYNALYIPAAITGTAGLAYGVYRMLRDPGAGPS
jgi:uncharacterized membrane protein YoaK (UPF0700 family)